MDIKYSIDKVKLHMYGVKLEIVEQLMYRLSMQYNVRAYEQKTVKSCRYNYIITEEDIELFGAIVKGENSFYVGIEPNWLSISNRGYRDIIIEYNPNKITLSEFPTIRELLLPINEYKTQITKMDVAIDLFGYDINDLLIYKRHGSEYKSIIEHNKIETVYIGAFGKSGHIKVYDKAKEQKSKTIWTRYEVTYKDLGFMDVRDIEVIEETKLAEIRAINKEVCLDGMKDTERVLMLATMDNIAYLDMLGRVMKAKIKSYHKKYLQEILIDKNEIIRAYKEFNIK